ncbi:MAG: ABC transporter ATP-binding protein [Myxococcales bacterium]|nr:ABC transporter ATP-binding protein [Myxococcales bacterium]USN51171.1 MAG: ABC transporter ATP-binding protein [Myxococcales bacterium]
MHDFDLIKRLIADLRPYKYFLTLGLILYVPLTLLNVLQPVIIGWAVSYGMLNGSFEKIISFALLFLLVVGLLAIVEWGQGYFLQVVGQSLIKDLRQKAFKKVQHLQMGFLDNTPVGKIITRLTNDAESAAELFSMGAIQIVGDLLFLAGTFVMLFFVDLHLSFYSMMILPILFLGIYFFRNWTKRAFISVRGVLSNLNAYLQEYLSGIATVQGAGRLQDSAHEFKKFNQEYLVANRQAILLESAIYSFVDALSYCASAAVLWGAFNLKQDSVLAIGVVVAFLEALSRFFQPIRELSNRFAVFQSAMVSLDRIYQLLEWPEEDDEAQEHKAHFNSEIEFSQISFAYQNGKRVLHNVNLKIKKGEHIALVGRTGAGKSTIIKLLNRFYQLSEGKIFIDGKDLNHMSLRDVRTLISVVPQEVFLFQGTIKDNLSFAKKNVSDEEIWQALHTVQLEALIQKRGGLLAAVEVRGLNFSVGERQLLAFARALIANPPIIVLDEATASIDARTEWRLQKATKKLLEDRTALIIAHRLATVMDCDRIVVFDKGQIAEQGTHQQLIAKDGIYAHSLRLQK